MECDLLASEAIVMFNNARPDEHEPLKDVFEGFNKQGCPLN
ncbi:MAG: hypothetical protein ABIG44_08215 [Planctomycetota bacterium]